MDIRFKMNFSKLNNNRYIPHPPIQTIAVKPTRSTISSLRAPMIDRVYKAKPGCSACGKKVA
jgi:hypothetical protein